MRRLLILLVFLPSLLVGQDQNFEIQGYLKGLPDNTVLTLKNDEISHEPLATASSKNGSFVMNGTIASPNIYVLSYNGEQKLFLFMDASKIRIKGHKDSLMYATVTGSDTQHDFIGFNKEFSPLYRELSQMTQQINSGAIPYDDAAKNKMDNLRKRINDQTASFVGKRPGSPVSPFAVLVSTQITEDPFVLEKDYLQMDSKVQESYFGKILKNIIDEKKIGAVGTEAIDFVQNDPNGNPISLSSFRGKYVLIDFWASWCGPCRMENPNVVSAFNKFSNKNFTILGVSLDKEKAPWLKAIDDDQLKWTQVSDLKFWSNEAAAKYHVQSIPQNFLVDPSGIIIARNLRGDQLHQKLSEILQ